MPYDGIYKLEVWGAQGGSFSDVYHGGYGGYSVAYVYLSKGEELFINVGSAGSFGEGLSQGEYNGGGNSTPDETNYTASGGGATHVATKTGTLKSLSSYAGNNNSPILIVAGGGGGAAQSQYAEYFGIGGNGGGIKGNDGTSENVIENIGQGGTQTEGGSSLITSGSFGQGGDAYTALNSRGGGGRGGYYGGGSGKRYGASGGGGSGYIANINIFDKYMTCYECQISDVESPKTYSNKKVATTPEINYSKKGNGHAIIIFIE